MLFSADGLLAAVWWHGLQMNIHYLLLGRLQGLAGCRAQPPCAAGPSLVRCGPCRPGEVEKLQELMQDPRPLDEKGQVVLQVCSFP